MRLAQLCLPIILVAGCAPTAAPIASVEPPRNLLVISVDTTRADHVGCYGYERDTTPSIDRLAGEGVRFTSAWTPMPLTLPAHSAIMTSRNPRGISVRSNTSELSQAALTLAERLKQVGFATAGFASAPVLFADSGLDQGFDVYVAPEKGTHKALGTHKSAGSWLAEHRDERFFAFIHFYDPHTEYKPPTKFRKPFGLTHPEKSQLPYWDTMCFMRKPARLTEHLVDQAVRGYDAELASADERIGLLMDELRRVELLEETLVFVVSDHGETFDELATTYGYAFDHGEFLHPREIHVPFILRAPTRFGFGQGRTLSAPISLLDIMPTALELLGVECVQPFEGRSLVELLGGGELPLIPIVTERQQYEGESDQQCISGEEWSVLYGSWLLVDSDGRGQELYDLSTDPDALTNLINSDQEWTPRLSAYLQQWKQDHPEGAEAVHQEISDDRRRALDALGYTGNL